MPNILSVKNMTKKFPGVIALKEVSLDLEEGEILAVIGYKLLQHRANSQG